MLSLIEVAMHLVAVVLSGCSVMHIAGAIRRLHHCQNLGEALPVLDDKKRRYINE